jgi:hypothetical protein
VLKDGLSEEQRHRLRKSRRFYPWSRTPGDEPTLGLGFRGVLFPPNVMPSSGEPAAVYVFIGEWATPIRKEDMRSSNDTAWTALFWPVYVTVPVYFEKELKDAGCVEKIVRHVRFKWLYGVHYPDHR